MIDVSNQELERRFAEHAIPRRRLYPWWYRLSARLGMTLKPPVLFTLADHFRYEGTWVAVIFVAGFLYTWLYLTTSVWALTPLFLMIFIIPLWSWWDYRRIRRRLGLE